MLFELISFLFGRRKPFAYDKTEGHPRVADCLRAIESRDGGALARLYDQMVPADRVHALDVLGTMTEIGQPLPESKADPRLAAIGGSLHYVWAHRRRGFSTGDKVGAEAGRAMHELALEAHELLKQAAHARPDDSTVKAFQLRALMLLGGGRVEAPDILSVIASGPEQNVWAHLAALNYSAPKWYGDHAAMHAVADAAIARGGSAAMHGLKARAHIEDWLYDVHMSDEDDRRRAFHAKSASPEFAASLAALDDAFHARAARSPMSFSERAFVHNQFAALFALFPNLNRMRPHLEAVGSKPLTSPWMFSFEGPLTATIAGLRKKAGLKAL